MQLTGVFRIHYSEVVCLQKKFWNFAGFAETDNNESWTYYDVKISNWRKKIRQMRSWRDEQVRDVVQKRNVS